MIVRYRGARMCPIHTRRDDCAAYGSHGVVGGWPAATASADEPLIGREKQPGRRVDANLAGVLRQPEDHPQRSELVPPEGKENAAFRMQWTDISGEEGPGDAMWYVETEFSDIRGARWRLPNERAATSAAATLRRVRTGRFDLWRPRG